MTIITKASGILRKQDLVNPPQLEFEPNSKQVGEEEKIEIQPEWPKRSTDSGMWYSLLGAILLLFLLFMAGLILYQQYIRPSNARRYQGICTVPITKEGNLDPSYRMLPLRWSDADVQIITDLDEEAGEEFVNALREELDLRDTMEKISVTNNGRRTNFLHDFGENITGIDDGERCFIMDLDPELVLSPELFITGLVQREQFDVSRVRSNMRAMLPALPQPPPGYLKTMCPYQLNYRLIRGEHTKRKRSADDPKPDYMQFSGKHVLELKIENLPEILAYEKKMKEN